MAAYIRDVPHSARDGVNSNGVTRLHLYLGAGYSEGVPCISLERAMAR